MLSLRTLGELRLIGPGGELLAGRRKDLVLLAYLARRSPRAVRRDELVELLWSQRETARGRQSLRQALVKLRPVVGEDLAVDADAVRLGAEAVELDSRSFEADVAAGRAREAVERWGGDFLPGAEDAGGEAYRAWLDAERERLRRRLSTAFELLVDAAADTGEWAEAARWAERWAEQLPSDEGAHLRWIEALSRDDRLDEARARHAGFLARLRLELGVEPSGEFLRLGRTLVEWEGRAHRPSNGSPGSAAIFTPDLVGRDAALAELRSAWRAVEEGASATVVVEGAEGLGKTLLCEQFLQSLEGDGRMVFTLRSRAHEGDAGSPWKTARDLLAPLSAAPGLGGASDEVLAEVGRVVPAILERFPRLPAASSDTRGLADALVRVLTTVAQEAPVVGFLDDLAYADLPSRELIVRLASLPHAGVLLLITARPEWLEASGPLANLYQSPGVRRVKLRALKAGEIEALLRSMLELPAEERRVLALRLHEETGGNPFYAAEIVGAMVDEGLLTADRRGVWHATPSTAANEPLPLPASVREAVGRRLARLSHGAQRVAGAATGLSQPIVRARLEGAAELPPEHFEAALDELIARRLLRPASPAAEHLEFAHPLIRRVARDRFGGPKPARPAPVPWWRTRRAVIAAAAIGVFALATAVALALRGTPANGPPIIAVGEIGRNGADSAGGAQALQDMLATNLARLPGLRVVSSARMYEVLAQFDSGAGGEARWAGAARRAGAGELLEGALHQTASGLRLDLRRVDLRTGAVREAYTVVGADAFEVVDRATAEIGTDFRLPTTTQGLAEVSTRSLPAYRFYEEGLRSYGAGDFRAAIRLFDAAVAEDSTFAMARHYVLLTRPAVGLPVSPALRRRLLALADDASERERLLIRATWGDASAADRAAAAETLAIRYPAEPDGHLLLGRERLASGEFLGALPHLWRVVAMDSLAMAGTNPRCRACDAFESIVHAYALADSMGAAERVAHDWARRQPGSARAWRAVAATAEAQERYEETLVARRAAMAITGDRPFDALLPAVLRIRAGDFAGADRMLGEMARDGAPEMRVYALWYLTISLRYQGRLREALETVRRARGLNPEEEIGGVMRQHQGQVLYEMGRFRDAAALADSLAGLPLAGADGGTLARHRTLILTRRAEALAAAGDTALLPALADSIEFWGRRSGYGRDWRLHHHVRGLLLGARSDHEAAAAAFERAIYSRTGGYMRTSFELGRSLLALGRPGEAVAVLQPAFRGGLEAGNLYLSRTDLHELLGRAWSEAGRPDSAAVHYGRALDAWGWADPAFHPRREAIRLRLAALRQAR